MLIGESPVQKSIVELLSQAAMNESIRDNLNCSNRQDRNCSDNAEFKKRKIHRNDAFSPLLKRRLKFCANNWREGPSISPLRSNHNLMVGNSHNRSLRSSFNGVI